MGFVDDRRVEWLLRRAFEASEIPMALIEVQPSVRGRLLRVNTALAAITAYAPERLANMAVADLVDADDVDVGLGVEQHRQPGAHDGLVVGDEDPDAHRGVPVRGRTASTRQPRSAAGPAWKVPPSSVARSRMPTRP